MKPYSILAAFALVSASAAAQQTSASAEQAAPEKEKKVCRTERLTGSRTKVSRICMTKAEWDRLAERTNKSIGDLSRQSSSNPRSDGGGAIGGGF